MVIVIFKDNRDWFRANWIFRQLASDIIRKFPGDDAIEKALKYAQAIGALFVSELDRDTRIRIIDAMKSVAEDTISERIEGWNSKGNNDVAGEKMYKESLMDLLQVIDRVLETEE